MKAKTSKQGGWMVAILLTFSVGLAGGCESDAQTGALVGAGVGALIGQAAGGDTGGTLVGAAVGGGVGYMIGNEGDKKKAAAEKHRPERSTKKSPLAGTSWQSVSFEPQPEKPFKSLVVIFTHDGQVRTNKIYENGKLVQGAERYYTVGDTLIINAPDLVINAEFAIENDQLIIDCAQFRGVFQRIGS